MKSGILNIYKPVGLSPFDMIKLLRQKDPEYSDAKITYAGRLDPMAEGVLVLLVGEAVHELSEYIKSDKEYESEILFGFETDTYDVLGFLQDEVSSQESNSVLLEKIKNKIKQMKREISLPFPPYSSYKIKGKPLFAYARENRLEEIDIPIKTTEIYDTEVLDSCEIKSEDLLNKITEKINKVSGDFRQEKTLKKWQERLRGNKTIKYLVVKARFSVSSGTYVRAIAHLLGQEFCVGAILFSLKRTRVGEFELTDSVRL